MNTMIIESVQLEDESQETISHKSEFCVNDNHEGITLIWYRRVHDEVEFESILKPKLNGIINFLKSFRNRHRCIRFIQSIHTEEVFIILANCLKTELDDLQNDLDGLERVRHIYVFAKEIAFTESKWKIFSKLQRIFTNEDLLSLQLVADTKSVNVSSFYVLEIDGDETSIKDLTKKSLMFVKSKLLL